MTPTSSRSEDVLTSSAYRLLIAFAMLMLLVSPGNAQNAATERTRVTLVSSPTIARGKRTEVVRRARRTPQNVIFVDLNATPEDLAGALALIQALRIQYGDHLQSDLRAKPEVVRHRPSWQQSAYRTWLIEQLVRLRRAPATRLADLGVVSAVQITLPASKGTVTSSGGSPQ